MEGQTSGEIFNGVRARLGKRTRHTGMTVGLNNRRVAACAKPGIDEGVLLVLRSAPRVPAREQKNNDGRSAHFIILNRHPNLLILAVALVGA